MRRNMYLTPLGAAVAAAAALTLVACAGGEGGAQSPGDDVGDLDIAFISPYKGLPYFTAVHCGALDAAAELGGGIEVSYEGPSKGLNPAEQLPVLDGVINRGPDGIIFGPADPRALTASVRHAMEDQNIPVVTIDSVLSEEVALAQFHGDQTAGGELAAEEVLRLTEGESGSVLVIDVRPGIPVTNQRAEGFMDAFNAAETDLTLMPIQYFEDDPNQAATIVQSTLASTPDLAAIFAVSEPGAMGAVSALQGADSTGITVVAYDAGPTLVSALDDGTVDALIAQGAYTQGYDALTRLVKYLQGEDVSSLPYDNSVENVLVTQDNMDDPDVQKYFYPESCS